MNWTGIGYYIVFMQSINSILCSAVNLWNDGAKVLQQIEYQILQNAHNPLLNNPRQIQCPGL